MSELFHEVQVSAVSPELLAMFDERGWTMRVIGDAPTNGKVAAAPEPKAKVTVEDGWTNASGYPCSKEFTAFTSSNGVARHLGGLCDCRKDGETCKPVTKGHVPADEFNSRPGVTLVKDEEARVFSFA